MRVALGALLVAAAAAARQSVYVTPQQSLADVIDGIDGQAPVDIILQPGVHRVHRPIKLTSRHSGMTVRGRGGAVVDGGVELPPFVAGANGVWTSQLPPAYFNSSTPAWTYPTQLFVNGQRRLRARAPNPPPGAAGLTCPQDSAACFGDAGTFHMASPLEPCSAPAWGSCPDVDLTGFVANLTEPGAPQVWWDLEDAWLLVFAAWTADWLQVQSFNFTTGTVKFATNATYHVGQFGYELNSPAGGRWVLENSFAALDAPGEWWVNRTNGTVYYMPLPGESPATLVASVPVTSGVFSIGGDSMSSRPVGVVLRDLTIVNVGEDTRARPGYGWARTAAIQVGYAVNTTIQNVSISGVMGNGVSIEDGVTNILTDRLNITDVGGFGITTVYAAGNLTGMMVSNCSIKHIGWGYWGQPACVHLSGAGGSAALHNECEDSTYTGIMLGQQVGAPIPPPGTPITYQYEIAYNRVTRYGLGINNDLGAIYGAADSAAAPWLPHNIHHNYMAEGYAYNYGAQGGYADNGISGTLWHHNVITAVGGRAQNLHCGSNNTFTNNLIYNVTLQTPPTYRTFDAVFGGCDSSGGTGEHVTVTNNVVYPLNNPIVYMLTDHFYQPPQYTLAADNNIYYWPVNASGVLSFPNGTNFSTWQAGSGQDGHSLLVDPQIVNPSAGDFDLAPTSPAWALGWTVIDLSTVGPIPCC